MEDDVIVCSICGEVIANGEYEEVKSGDIVCQSCLDDHYTKCDECGEYVPTDEITITGDGDSVCETCLQNNYVLCDECGEYYREEETVYISNYSTTVCDSCCDRVYSVCTECGEYVHDDDVYRNDDGEAYCESCYDDNYYHCSDCGCEVFRDDVYWVHDEPYCECCASEHEECDSDDIYDYHAFNHHNYIPRYSADDDRTTNPHLYGLELEVAGDTGYASDVLDILNGNAIAMYDSSVDGFELVFMPITRKYLYKELRPTLEKAVKFLSSHGFYGHNKGGIHVHFTQLENSMQVANMTQIMYGSEKDRKIWQKITQRRAENMHWCSMTTSVPSADEIIEHNIYAPAGTGNHGTALNYCTRTGTHELRIFNSNLRIERILKNFECVFALEDYVARASEPICNTRGFLNFVDEHAEDYPHLVAFMHEKRIFEIANRFYGDTYNSKPSDVQTLSDVKNETVVIDVVEDDDIPTDSEIAELVASVA